MELLFNLDEASLRFYSPDHCTEHGVLLIFGNGNEGRDVISDWNYSEGDADRFNAIMDQFEPEDVLAELDHEELKAKYDALVKGVKHLASVHYDFLAGESDEDAIWAVTQLVKEQETTCPT